MTQAVFCDISTPGKGFNLYEELRQLLTAAGVPEEEIAPGDILLFYRGGWIGHAGIYIGEGQYIHAMDVGIGVVLSPMDEIRTEYEIRRVFVEEQE